MGFRTIASKYGVSEHWTGSVETTIIDHLKAWGEWEESKIPEFTMKEDESDDHINAHDISEKYQWYGMQFTAVVRLYRSGFSCTFAPGNS